MSQIVLVVWIVQAAAGVVLLARRLGHGARAATPVVVHVALSLASLTCWVAFTVGGAPLWGWIAFVGVTLGNGVGDTLLVGRSRGLARSRSSFGRDYLAAIRSVFSGRMPRLVTFHALFAGVAYFGALAACIAASV